MSSNTAPTKFQFSAWRHGGWYVHDVRYPSGAIGCVSRNYPDGKWRIVCGRPHNETFPTRHAAALAEFAIAAAECAKASAPVEPVAPVQSAPEALDVEHAAERAIVERDNATAAVGGRTIKYTGNLRNPWHGYEGETYVRTFYSEAEAVAWRDAAAPVAMVAQPVQQQQAKARAPKPARGERRYVTVRDTETGEIHRVLTSVARVGVAVVIFSPSNRHRDGALGGMLITHDDIRKAWVFNDEAEARHMLSNNRAPGERVIRAELVADPAPAVEMAPQIVQQAQSRDMRAALGPVDAPALGEWIAHCESAGIKFTRNVTADSEAKARSMVEYSPHCTVTRMTMVRAPGMVRQPVQQQQGRDMRAAQAPVEPIDGLGAMLARIEAATGPRVVLAAPRAAPEAAPDVVEFDGPGSALGIAACCGLISAAAAYLIAAGLLA